MESISIEIVLEKIYSKFPKGAHLSLHLMGDAEDLLNSYKFFEKHKVPSNFQLTLLIPVKYYSNWHQRFGLTPGYEIGIWLDNGNWTTFRFLPKVTYLLMTVQAGKSGQN
ncbi:hypothetical protein HC766_00360 [Candidatus Gracilibacteria bacterium]|nr:hypothetical protein [Candidatus Gracilibacteria bacterium]